MLEPIVPRAEIVVGEIGPVVGVHTGPATIGVTWLELAPLTVAGRRDRVGSARERMAEPTDARSRDSRAARRRPRAHSKSLLERHLDRIHAVCRRVLGHPEDALDATQEALIAIARGINRFDGRSQFTTWMYRVATNAALDEARRRRRRPVPSEQLPERASVGRRHRRRRRAPRRRRRARRRCPPTTAPRSPCATSPASTTPRSRPCSTSRSAPCGRASRAVDAALADQLGNHDHPPERPTPRTP